MKLLEQYEVADNVLDVVSHHRGSGGKEKDPEIRIAECNKGAMLNRRLALRAGIRVQVFQKPRQALQCM